LQSIGSDLDKQYDGLLYEFYKMLKKGVGFREITKILNYRSLALIYWAFEEKQNNSGNSTEFGLTMLDMHFTAFRLDEEALNEWVNAGYKRLSNGEIPWDLVDAPFQETRVEYTIDNLERRIKQGKFHYVPYPSETDVSIDDAALFLKGRYEKLNEMLRGDSAFWGENGTWIEDRMALLSRSIENSISPQIQKMKEIGRRE
jgi:hypothetical protein